jgi:alkylation response protein AidB-like acyl-CoA dehydrogenase
MMFELSAEHLAARDRARAFASEHLMDEAGQIDRSAAIPATLLRDASRIVSSADATSFVVAIEELAAASPTIAAAVGLGVQKGSQSEGASGLRGVPVVDQPTEHGRLALAAVALGIGRAALEIALERLRLTATASDNKAEKPQWALADAATELEAARLITLQAAQAVGDGDAEPAIATARLLANAAAHQSVNAALRIVGEEALREGSVLERLARDVRAVSLQLGTEDDHRAVAAEGLLG